MNDSTAQIYFPQHFCFTSQNTKTWHLNMLLNHSNVSKLSMTSSSIIDKIGRFKKKVIHILFQYKDIIE